MRLKLSVLAILALGLMAWKSFPDHTAQAVVTPGVSEARTIRAMKYHGIDFCIHDDKKSYFYRDGQKCSLFTQAFIAKEANGK